MCTHVFPACRNIGLLCSLVLTTLRSLDGDADGGGGGGAGGDGGGGDVAAAAAGEHCSGRRDCNIGQRLHSCFKLDLLKSFRRATPTGAN